VVGRELDQRKFRKILGTTYIGAGSVILEYAVIDPQIGTAFSINSAPLKVACPAPGIRANF
jgi:hypothetical protein